MHPDAPATERPPVRGVLTQPAHDRVELGNHSPRCRERAVSPASAIV